MSGRSDEAYKRIQEVGNRAGKWLDRFVSQVVKDNAARIVILVLVGLIALQGLALLPIRDKDLSWLGLVLKNVGPELAGIVFGVVAIDLLNERRQDEQLKEQLILQMGSSHNDVTDTAIRALRARGWLSDGSLSGADLQNANLSGADLQNANLSGADLQGADLSGADLRRADLSGADLGGAHLSMVILWEANLSGATLWNTNLSGADLLGTDLSGATLRNTNLSGAVLRNTDLSDATLRNTNLRGAGLLEANLSGAELPSNLVINPDNWKAVILKRRTLLWSRD